MLANAVFNPYPDFYGDSRSGLYIVRVRVRRCS
jgi:hypothetical protein